MPKQKTRYVCQSCGATALRWFGRCPGCGQWNTCAEESAQEETKRPLQFSAGPPAPITEVEMTTEERHRTEISEFDRVLGGGIVPGSIVLVGGDPGIGKSTLLLQVSGKLGSDGQKVLYVSGEESPRQTRMRAGRIGALTGNLFVLSETNLDVITSEAEKLSPSMVVIDSVQTVYSPELESAPGSISQVRECAGILMHLAKRTGIPVFLVGHVTKEGAIAGPKVLEHIVDTVLYLEGERHHSYRILRAAKNRFGSTNEIGVFEMEEGGMVGIENPSEVFLSERSGTESGSVVVCSIEGTRPILVEIQALVSPANFGYPQRVAAGIDNRRLSILIAVLEKRAGLTLGTQDVFIKVAGGVRIEEPSVDLGIATAISSSFRDAPVDPDTVVIGEVGLGGEIRPVGGIDKRVKEAAKLGFRRCIIAKGNLKGLRKPDEMETVAVKTVEEALREAL